MNKYNKFLLAVVALLVITSCNSFLDREPLDSLSPGSFFRSEGDLGAYAVKNYKFSTPEGWAGAGIWAYDNHTDNQAATGYDNRWVPGEWRVPESHSDVKDDPWNFTQIYEVNYFLNNVPPLFDQGQIQGSPATIRHYIGEVYFLRAFEYFKKLQTLGDFPIIKDVLPDEKETLIAVSKREPRYKVARFILEDLNKALEMLNNTPPGGKNRITRNVALLLKSRVALYEASWLKYHQGTAMVPGGKGWGGNAVDITGFDIQQEITYFLAECKKASAELADAVTLAENTGVDKKMDNPYFAQFSANNMEGYPEILMWRAYNLGDYSIVHSSPFYVRVGGNTGLTRQYVETFLCDDGKPIYASDRYKGDESLLNVRANRDQRLQLFMMTPGEILSPRVVGDTKDILPLAPAILDIAEKRCVTGYQIRKGLSDNWYRDGNSAIEGIPLFRATEAYLNYIEASCMENGEMSIDTKAQEYWKQLRKRAGLPEDYMITVNATNLSKESDWGVYSANKKVSSLLYSIRRERRCELVEEGFRMEDLKRWRALDQVSKFRVEGVNLWESDLKDMYKNDAGENLLLQEGVDKSPNVSGYVTSGKYLCPYRNVKDNNIIYDAGYNWVEAHYLSPIAVTHFRITASDANSLTTSTIYQNPGWPLVAGQGAK
ncbi:MAG: RagB/SusD family nutrient uptake outer membrane protein [Bacteroidia bacterium]|nr:RagB/SusD family nutrient uptake outer membrane protein [Bacteroidia bacterium]